jgi:hypothetical protein
VTQARRNKTKHKNAFVGAFLTFVGAFSTFVGAFLTFVGAFSTFVGAFLTFVGAFSTCAISLKKYQYMESESLDLPLDAIHRLLVFEKWIPDIKPALRLEIGPKVPCTLFRRIGLKSEDGKGYHKYKGFNRFAPQVSPFPDPATWSNGFNPESVSDVLRYSRGVLDPTAKVFEPPKTSMIESAGPGAQAWKTRDFDDTGFVVIQEERVSIYGRTRDVVVRYVEYKLWFVRLVKVYDPLEIFIGKSERNDRTDRLGNFGPKFDGNSLLLRIGTRDEFRYVHIGVEVFEFSAPESITKYVSSYGDRSYPFAESQNWCYDMLSLVQSPVQYHPERMTRGAIYEDSRQITNPKKLDNFVEIEVYDSDPQRTELSPEECTRIWEYRYARANNEEQEKDGNETVKHNEKQ